MSIHINDYNHQLTLNECLAAMHREYVGGLWDELGQLQLEFMVARGGLRADMKLLDVGCGCFRGGAFLIPYLQDNYYGLDINASLIEAGLTIELPKANLSLARDHVLVRDDFDARHFGVLFDRILAVSVWTHLPLNHIERSLWQASRVLKPGGIFFSSIFECPADQPLMEPCYHSCGGIMSYRDRDPYHYRPEDFKFLLRQLEIPLQLEWVGEWGHPRNQQMLAFHRFDI